MAETLEPSKIVIPQQTESISRAGVAEMRALGATANTAIAGKASTAYVDDRAYDRGRVPVGADALGLASGSWTVSSTTVADTMTNLPEAWPGKLISDNGGEALVRAVTFKPYARDYVWENATTTGGGWGGWRKVGTGSTSSLGSGVTNSLLVQDYSRRHGGVWSTGGKGVVSVRLDHGLLNFRDKLKPILDGAGIVPSLALNSRNWDRAENGGITATTVNGWVAAGDVEIWNHSATHTNPTTEAGVVDEVVNGLDELRTQLPDAQIDGWAVPGVGADPYMGMGSGTSVEQIAGSYAGRLILESHAVMTGYISGTHQRIADGVVRQAQAHFSLDSKTVTEARNEIDAAIASGTALQLMLHPSVVDGTGTITAFQFQQIIDHIVAKRDAGELVVCTPYEMMLADSSNPPVAVPDVTGLAARLAALEYDSGRRDITALLPEGATGSLFLWRIGATVWLDFQNLSIPTAGGTWAEVKGLLPAGFRPPASWPYMPLAPAPGSATMALGPVRIGAGGDVLVYDAQGGRAMRGLVSFPTANPIPASSPPGTPA